MDRSTYTVRTIDGVVSTDDIIPGRYKHMFSDPEDLKAHVFENYRPGFAASLGVGTALWSESLFGIGSSREQAATSLRAAGVSVVLAPRFGRIFYRNAWNIGLMLVELGRPAGSDLDGSPLAIDWQSGILQGRFGELSFAIPPKRLMAICEAGGLLNWVTAARANGTHGQDRNG